jgi:predicted nucleotidyltransferase
MSPDERLTRVLASAPDVTLAVLFGSVARNEARAASDLDVGVLFASGRPDTSAALAAALARATGRQVDVVRLNDAPPLLRFEIARDGRLLLERTAHAWIDFRAKAMIDWWDWAPTARTLHAAAISRLREKLAHGAP